MEMIVLVVLMIIVTSPNRSKNHADTLRTLNFGKRMTYVMENKKGNFFFFFFCLDQAYIDVEDGREEV